MVNTSIARVLDDSVACSNSEEGFTLLVLPWFHVVGLNGQLGFDFFFLLFVFEVVEVSGFLDFSVLEE